MALKEKRRGAVAETPFKGPSPMKESCGAGDFYGTLQGKVDYIAVRTPAMLRLASAMRND